MDFGKLIDVLPSIAIAVLFAWYAERRDNRQTAEQTARDKLAAEERANRDSEWREFLRTESAATVEALRNISVQFNRVETAVLAYSAKFDEAMIAMRAVVGTRKGDTGPIGKP